MQNQLNVLNARNTSEMVEKMPEISAELADEFESIRLARGGITLCDRAWDWKDIHHTINHSCGRRRDHEGPCVCGYVLCFAQLFGEE